MSLLIQAYERVKGLTGLRLSQEVAKHLLTPVEQHLLAGLLPRDPEAESDPATRDQLSRIEERVGGVIAFPLSNASARKWLRQLSGRPRDR